FRTMEIYWVFHGLVEYAGLWNVNLFDVQNKKEQRCGYQQNRVFLLLFGVDQFNVRLGAPHVFSANATVDSLCCIRNKYDGMDCFGIHYLHLEALGVKG